MKSRLEILREEIDSLIMNGPQNKICLLSAHIYGVSKFCTLLALKRNLDAELAVACGMLHDVYYMKDISGKDHAEKGAILTKEILDKSVCIAKMKLNCLPLLLQITAENCLLTVCMTSF